MMTELDSLRLLAGGRFIFIRFFLLLLGILGVSGIFYFELSNFSLVYNIGPVLVALLFLAFVVNLFFLISYSLVKRKSSLGSLNLLNLTQMMFDVLVIFTIMSLLSSTESLWPLLFFLPIFEAILFFDNSESFWIAFLVSTLLFVLSLAPTYSFYFIDGISVLTFFPKDTLMNLNYDYVNLAIFIFSYLFIGIALPYYTALLHPRGLISLRKTYLKKEETDLSKKEQIEWVKNYSKKLEENNRLLRAKELELSLAKQKLEILDHAKSEFISVATHQLRTPLSAIKWTFNMILSGQLGEVNKEQKEFLDKGYESSLRMIGIVNNLVHIDHATAKKEVYNFADTNIVELLKNISFEFSNQMESKNITLEVDTPKKELPLINLDPNKIRMVIENLLDNGIKYTPRGGKISMSIKDDNLNSSNQSLKIIISDTGVGIPENEQKKIFRKFFRASNARLQEPDGSGIGLYIAKDIIERHGGALWFESKEGQGTTFFITLPVHQNVKNSV